jgi:UDP-2,3-diacylglucosamine pyrophosphatase LpxH
MKKLRVVLSDFHLGNGRFLPDGTVNALEDFAYDEKLIELVEYYGFAEGSDDVEIILNGDFFNMIQLMPEEQALGIVTERAALNKIEAIMAGHQALFETLRRFNAEPERRIVFIMGNHDPGLLWPGVREAIERVVGGEVRFVEEAYVFDGVHIEHGHQIEPIHRFEKDRYFLTRGFPEPVLNLPWGTYFVKDFLYRVKRSRPYVDKVKPFGKFMRWCLFNDFWFGLTTVIRYFWFIVKTCFSRLPLKRKGALKGLSAWLELARSPTLVEGAEEIMRQTGARIVVMGHSHIPFVRNFGNERVYLNPGTWNDITSLDIPSLGHDRRLLYVLIEYRDGRPYANLMEWHGHTKLFSPVVP